MTAREPYSEAMLEMMLRRRASRGELGNLHEDIAAVLEHTQPRRAPWSLGGIVPTAVFARRLPLGLAVLLLLALLAGALIAGAAWLQQDRAAPISLVPTVVETVTPEDFTATRVVEDGTGTLWALGVGQVTRFDPSSGDRRTWTVSDDMTFGSWVASPARAGGIWIWSGGSILRFTGEAFADTIPAGRRPIDMAEAPDGTLWALSADRGLERWTGGRWVSPADAAPISDPHGLLAIGSDEAWVVGEALPACRPPARCGAVAHLDHGSWTDYPWRQLMADDVPEVPVEAPDGSIWVGPTETGAARFDGDRWMVVDGPGQSPFEPLAATTDGSVWAVTREGSLANRGPDGSWSTHGPSEGLPASRVRAVTATAQGVFAVNDAGLLRFVDGRWTPLWSDLAPGPRLGTSYGITALVGVSGGEAWASDGNDQLWHFVNGAWEGPSRPPGFEDTVVGLATGPDGSLWVADSTRVAVFRSDGWTTAWVSEGAYLFPNGLDIGADGTAWVGTYDGVVRITPVGRGFDVQAVDCPIPGATVAVASDGTVWVGGDGWAREPGLAHVIGGRCEAVDPRPDPTSRGYEVRSIDTDPRGGVIVSVEEPLDGFVWFTSDAVVTSNVVRINDGHRSLLGQAVATSGSMWAAVAPSGDVWWAYGGPVVATPEVDSGPGGLARFDGEQWVQIITGGSEWDPISISPDGTVWFASPSAIHRIRADAQP